MATVQVAVQTLLLLNGTWQREGEDGTTEFTFNNGNFEIQDNGVPYFKGTYTTSGNKITITFTHMYGEMMGLESKWYTKDELKASGYFATFTDDGDSMFAPQTSTYSVNGDKLLYNGITFTKK